MKPINIKSLLQAKDSLSPESFDTFVDHFGINIREAELGDLRTLAKDMAAAGCSIGDLDKFYIGYKIPQIGKEFDLLRFGKESIINIEIKSRCTKDRIEAQLQRNHYYLKFLGRKVHAFTFISETGELYLFDDGRELKAVEHAPLIKLIRSQVGTDSEIPDNLFNPSDYLVSPFNSTQRFLAGEYFLTHQQEEVKTQITKSIKSSVAAKFISISGSAGTGKTLLTYDIARDFSSENKRALILHCGQLNQGHAALISKGWNISPIKTSKSHDLADFDLLVIDEAQRIYQYQLDDLVNRAKLAKCSCIFSLDKVQTLSNQEEKNNIAEKISAISQITEYRLSEKIRTNKEIATFIKMLFNNKKNANISCKDNIEVNYFDSIDDAKSYLSTLDSDKWEVLRFTPSQYNNEQHKKYSSAWNKTAHQVIGQEFDGVAVALDRYFSYDEEGDLIYRAGSYYAPVKMLFQNITRARKSLNLVIVGNEELMNRCLKILQ